MKLDHVRHFILDECDKVLDTIGELHSASLFKLAVSTLLSILAVFCRDISTNSCSVVRGLLGKAQALALFTSSVILHLCTFNR